MTLVIFKQIPSTSFPSEPIEFAGITTILIPYGIICQYQLLSHIRSDISTEDLRMVSNIYECHYRILWIRGRWLPESLVSITRQKHEKVQLER